MSTHRPLVAGAAALILCCPIGHAEQTGQSLDTTANSSLTRWFDSAARLWSTLSQRLSLQNAVSSARALRARHERALLTTEISDSDRVSVVLQRKRQTRPDMLTVRYELSERGSLRTYAGAGLNRAAYLDDYEQEPSRYWLHRSRQTVGAAAELGAEWRLGDNLSVNADLRWLDFDGDAQMLRTEVGMIEADRLMAGLAVVWRFQ